MRIALAGVGVSVVVATCTASAVVANASNSTYAGKPKRLALPYQTIAKGTQGPAPYNGAVPPTPAALIRAKRSGWVYLNVYAGRFDVGGYDISIKSVSIVDGRFQVKAALTVPTLFGPGVSLPYQFIRIKQSAIRGKVPQSAYLVQVERGLQPHTSIRRLVTFARRLGGKIVSATLVRNYDTIKPWTQGGVSGGPPVWYLRCVGNLHFGFGGLAPTGYYLVNDQTSQGFGGGFP